MSYLSSALLENDSDFQLRNRACVMEQAEHFKNDTRLDFVALSNACLRDEPGPVSALLRTNANGPGIGDKVDLGNGKIDQSLVTDGDLLALTQSNWQVVAGLYFKSDGTPIP